ncbi:MAG: HU family DNA-binding protein [Prevotella sp.]|nr:HU family DNA-binding protein [Prevotella sp.]MBQ9650793.1 HU family DNA-binding protein [Prevotella sp.]
MKYTIYQNKSSRDKVANLWFARADIDKEAVTPEQIEELVQRNCSMKASDVSAVLKELSEVLADKLKEGKRVVVKGIGSFKLGLTSTGAESLAKFDVKKNITGAHVIFIADKTYNGATGTYINNLTNGVKFTEAKKYAVEEAQEDEQG